MKTPVKRNDITSVVPAVLFLIFTLCMMFVLLTGTRIYKNISDANQDAYDRRTVGQYIAMRVRQNDTDSGVFVGDFGVAERKTSGDTLYLSEVIRGVEYHTSIYCYNGYLYELYAKANAEFLPGDGERLLAVDSIVFFDNGDVISVDIQYADTTRETLYFTLRSSEVMSDEK